MGWLFAVGLGLQEQKRTAVLRALPPIALGHALSIGIIIAAVLLARISVPGFALKIAAAAILFAFGLYRLFRSRHPNWVGMRVGFGDLTLWSFVMASAHGAGLMLIPLFLKSPPPTPGPHGGAMSSHMHSAHGLEFANLSTPYLLTSSIAVHTLGLSFGNRPRRNLGLRKIRGRHLAPGMVQPRRILDVRPDDHWLTYPLPLK